MKYPPYLFGYFPKKCTWEEAAAREEWVREFLDVLLKHTPTNTFLKNCTFSDGVIQRFVTTQLQPPKKVSALHRFQHKLVHDHLPYESLDWQTPLGICRFLEEVAAGPSGKVAEFFVRFVPRNDMLTQRASELYLGTTHFENLVVKRKFQEASRILRLPTKCEYEKTKRLVSSFLSEWTYPESLDQFERQVFQNRKQGTLHLLEEIRDISNELRTFLQTHTLDETKVQSRLSRIEKIIHIGSNPENIVEVSPDEFEQVFRPDTNCSSSHTTNNNSDELVRECERLSKLLEQHRIDYVQVPNDSLQQLQTFIEQQTAAQQKCVHILFDESSSNADKFRAENDIDKIQKKLETAKRKQFDFPDFLQEQLQKLERFRPEVERTRSDLRELLKDINPFIPFSKLPFRVRRSIDPFAQSSNTHFQCWLNVIRQDDSIDYLKYEGIRTSVEQLFETKKRTQGLLLAFHFGHERCMQVFTSAFRLFLLSLSLSLTLSLDT